MPAQNTYISDLYLRSQYFNISFLWSFQWGDDKFNTDTLYCLFQEESIQRQMQKDIIVNLLKYGAETIIQDEVRSLFVN